MSLVPGIVVCEVDIQGVGSCEVPHEEASFELALAFGICPYCRPLLVCRVCPRPLASRSVYLGVSLVHWLSLRQTVA